MWGLCSTRVDGMAKTVCVQGFDIDVGAIFDSVKKWVIGNCIVVSTLSCCMGIESVPFRLRAGLSLDSG